MTLAGIATASTIPHVGSLSRASYIGSPLVNGSDGRGGRPESMSLLVASSHQVRSHFAYVSDSGRETYSDLNRIWCAHPVRVRRPRHPQPGPHRPRRPSPASSPCASPGACTIGTRVHLWFGRQRQHIDLYYFLLRRWTGANGLLDAAPASTPAPSPA